MNRRQRIVLSLAAALSALLLNGMAQATLAGDVNVQLIAPGGVSGNPAGFTLQQTAPLATGIKALNIGGDALGAISSYMLDYEQIVFSGNSVLIRVAAGADDGLGTTTSLTTGYLGVGADHARYQLSGLSIANAVITGLSVYGFDGYATTGSAATSGLAGWSSSLPGSFAHLIDANTLSFDLDTMVFKDRGVGSSGAYAEFRIDLNTEVAAPVPEPSTLALMSLGLLGLAAARRSATRN